MTRIKTTFDAIMGALNPLKRNIYVFRKNLGRRGKFTIMDQTIK